MDKSFVTDGSVRLSARTIGSSPGNFPSFPTNNQHAQAGEEGRRHGREERRHADSHDHRQERHIHGDEAPCRAAANIAAVVADQRGKYEDRNPCQPLDAGCHVLAEPLPRHLPNIASSLQAEAALGEGAPGSLSLHRPPPEEPNEPRAGLLGRLFRNIVAAVDRATNDVLAKASPDSENIAMDRPGMASGAPDHEERTRDFPVLVGCIHICSGKSYGCAMKSQCQDFIAHCFDACVQM